ncbi:hybrid sensor histidine kinase/response regulator (plasmid) [Pseudoalteromonas sp. T1lg65]|uniref:hybrid sensor histidine kinase/response regulator n=1 Tax=Pseudoalteromonas sp. T1lg65 TaxID=2077101 RepID=UPI003F79A385
MSKKPSPLSFLSPDREPTELHSQEFQPWLVLVVDDEPQVHEVTALVLSSYRFESRPIKLLHAYSKAETMQVMQQFDSIALVLLDVIMENENSGFECVQFIREELRNEHVRIVLRTGQSGDIPEHELMLKYDINDYKAKTDLTKARLFTTLTAALRSYRDIIKLEQLTKQLQAQNGQLELQLQQGSAALAKSNSELHQATARIEQQQNALQQSEKLASVGELAAGIAHQIGDPLGYLKGNLEFVQATLAKFLKTWQTLNNHPEYLAAQRSLLEELEQQYQIGWSLSESDDVIAEMRTGLERIQYIIKELNMFFIGSQNKIQQVKFTEEILQPVLTNLEFEGVSLKDLNCENSNAIELHCAPILMQHAIYCVLRNAIESRQPEKAQVNLQATVNEPNLIIMVIDSGHGISHKHLARIFEPFFTTKPPSKHCGLGLAMVSNILKIHGGDIEVESTSGRGTKVTLHIPLQT